MRSKTQNAVKIMAKGGGLVVGKRGFDRLLSGNFWSLRWQRSGGKLSSFGSVPPLASGVVGNGR